MNQDAERERISTGLSRAGRTDTYELDKAFRLNPHAMVYGIVGGKGGTAREFNF